jgi:hypothetical protein
MGKIEIRWPQRRTSESRPSSSSAIPRRQWAFSQRGLRRAATSASSKAAAASPAAVAVCGGWGEEDGGLALGWDGRETRSRFLSRGPHKALAAPAFPQPGAPRPVQHGVRLGNGLGVQRDRLRPLAGSKGRIAALAQRRGHSGRPLLQRRTPTASGAPVSGRRRLLRARAAEHPNATRDSQQ